DKQTLRKAAATYPDYIKAKYLQLPSTLPPRVKSLAHSLLDNIPNAYDKAETLENFLRSPPYSYSPQVKATPPGKDPIEYFLFDLRQDFCEYFASAMVVMLREAGVPAVRSLDPRPALAFLGFLLLLLVLAVVRFNWRFRNYGPIESAWGKTRLLASYVGHPPHPSQTTYEFASSLGTAIPETQDPV